MFINLGLAIFSFFKSLGLAGAFLSMLIENVGVPLPTEVGYLISQDLINSGRYSYYFVLIVLTLGHLSGSIISYYVGLIGNNRIRKSKRVIEVQEKLERWYARYGNATVFLTRFVGYVRPWSSYVAGFARVNIWVFIFWTFLGSLIFNIIALYSSNVLILIWRKYAVLHFGIVVTSLLLFFALVIYGLWKKISSKKGE